MDTSLEIIEQFVKRVCERAENTIKETHKLEGAHYAAMMLELQRMRNLYELADKNGEFYQRLAALPKV